MFLKKFIAWCRVPWGMYCDKCPYWRPNIAPIKIGDRTIAYCVYLDKTDIDIVKEREDWDWKEMMSGEELKGRDLIPSFSSLLWDGCKECGIKDDI